ncbi:hypothetical protein AMJ71_04355 [candidate division TA06 bacterium SM1_40]|uniref:Carbohydrate kinase PfkB domain-containing protein n=1 Tax=candidate division TA06 bacterium SM1_40 TaxID=1703773 RepID=A0A0S8JKR3_UNCT6|nr:MAG: hypothetical protein AMJ71_04355 [candidate division TA06 bacterium SM1_40]
MLSVHESGVWMKIAVLGTINYDTIIADDGRSTSSLGGIVYNVLSLAYLDSRITICPVAWVGEDRRAELFDLFAPHANIDTSGIRANPSGTNENTLVYRVSRAQRSVAASGVEAVSGTDRSGESGTEVLSESRTEVLGESRTEVLSGSRTEVLSGSRTEVLSERVPQISYEMAAPFLDADAILLNFISGRDVDGEVVEAIRRDTDAVVAIDVHSLSLGIAADGSRFPRRIEDWEIYPRSADIVQCNALELSLLFGDRLLADGALDEAARRVLGTGARVVALTLGARGSIVFEMRERRAIRYRVPPLEVDAVDTTGCGDTYGAAFMLEYLRTGDAGQAGALASAAAGLCATVSGVEGMEVVRSAATLQETIFGERDSDTDPRRLEEQIP